LIKAVFTDIDETLTNSNREVTEKTCYQIKRCIEKGILIILTSGRARKDATNYQKQIGASPYIISSNGAYCYDELNGIEIFSEPIKKEVVKQLLEYAQENEYTIKFNYKDKIVLNKALFLDEKDKEKTVDELKNIIETENIVQCIVSSSDIEKMMELKSYLAKNFHEVKIVNESKKLKNPELKPSKNYYCDIASATISKGKAVHMICQYLNLSEEEIITIGDGENDISMFNITPNSVAMGNALEYIKKQAKYITLSNDEDGVAKVLEKL
jgi:Cof subfamily protein (haloacid dehalogenase superfamily)